MDRKKHYNEHRQGKKSFQAMLTEQDLSIIATVKTKRGLTTARDLLLTLCAEELARIEARQKRSTHHPASGFKLSGA